MKTTTKTVRKTAKKAPVAQERPQNAEFWVKRPKDDHHMDWPYTDADWLEGYVQSTVHPHRDVVMDIMATFDPFSTVLEIGCSAGPNLLRIHERFPHAQLYAIDPNADSVEKVKSVISVEAEVGRAQRIPFDTNKFDVVLADASLMYVEPEEIDTVMNEVARVSKKYVIIVDRFNKSKSGEVTGYVWGRNYSELLRDRGYTVQEIKMKKKDWPTSVNWQKYGRFTIACKS